MELRHLRYFVAVAEELSVTRAAARLHITQPTLSRQMQELEEALGTELFLRSPAGLALSPAGHALLTQARELLDQAQQITLAMRRFTDCRNLTLDIGYIAPALDRFLSAGLRVFAEVHPKVTVRLYEMSPAAQIAALEEGRLDIALPGHVCPDLAQKYDLFLIHKIALHAVLCEKHKLAGRRSLKLKELEKEPFIALDEATYPGRNTLMKELCAGANFTPQFAQTADGLNTALALVGSGAGVILMPAEVQRLAHRHVVFVPLEKARAAVDFQAVVAPGEKRPAVRVLLQEFRAQAKLLSEASAPEAAPEKK